MQLIEWILLISTSIFISVYAYTVNVGESRVCLSHMKDISGFPREGSYKILLQTFGHNCTHIIGNLILTDLYVTEDGSDPDLSFLESIREITGYLIIMHSNVANIPLSNLRVIRAQNGGYRIRSDLEPAALLVRQNFKNGLPLRHIDFRSLRSIVQGSVYVYDNPGLCQWPDAIDWAELFERPNEQKVHKSVPGERNTIDHASNGSIHVFHFDEKPPVFFCGQRECSDTCKPFEGTRYCWGPSARDCQHHTSCGQIPCDRCFVHENHTGCCHEQCLGGCHGPLATQCEICREFNNSGACVSHCPRPFTSQSGFVIPGSKMTYRLGNLCVPDCPTGFLVENDACVTHCTLPGMQAVGRVCQPCDGPCPKPCELKSVQTKNGFQIQLIGAPALRSLSGCTHLRGDLVLSNESFYSSNTVPDHEPITKVDQLWALHSLREVTGYVYLDLSYFGSSLKNMTFLENLVKVSGVFSLMRTSVLIMNSMAEEPGLRSLREVPHGQIVFHNNVRMCFLNTLPWTTSRDINPENTEMSTVPRGNMRIIVESGADDEQCARSGAYCHPDCDVHGCWGPRADQCVRCRHLRAGPYLCVQSCDALPGFRTDPIASNHSSFSDWPQFTRRLQQDAQFREAVQTGLGQPEATHVCLPCHAECEDRCSGPGADECIGGCKTAWYNGFCVANCPRDTYLNTHRRICEPCNSQCHSREVSQKPVCTGPEAFPGSGGCNRCEKILYSPDSEVFNEKKQQPAEIDMRHVTCLRGDCPAGTYLSTELIHPFANSSLAVALAQFAETRTHVVPVCRPCHPVCKQCSAYSVFRSTNQQLGCIECAGWWHRDTCVEQCPASDTYSIRVRKEVQSTLISTAMIPNTSLSSDSNATDSNPDEQWVRYRNGNCLACHPECHSGCWNAGSNHCHLCSHFRIQLTLLPSNMVINNTNVKDWKRQWTDGEPNGENGRIRFICVPQCPPELPFQVVHPINSDRLCHVQATLSTGQRDQLFRDQAILTGTEYHTRLPFSSGSGLLWFSGLIILVTAFVLCCCCLRLRLRAWDKQHPRGRTIQSRLGRKLATAIRWKTRPGTFEQMKTWTGGAIECQPLTTYPDGRMRRANTCSTVSQASNTYSNHTSGPNLGRLVMINSDDLILNKQFGPLGSGAFGAVYRGLWRVHGLDDASSGYATSRIDEVSCVNRPQSMQSCGTQSTGLTAQTDEECTQLSMRPGTEQTHSSGPVAGSIRPGRSTEPRLLHVAVKILNDSRRPSDLQALLDEAKVMASVSHKHCLPLLGVCLSQTRKCLVSTYVLNGSLDRYLRVHEPDLPNTLLLEWASQIADGMAYLQSRGIIHRDLATRNVLVTTREHLQITDFGLAKMLEGEDEVRRGEVVVRSGRVPMRWLAIETLTHGRYSFKTDVWAYGVTIWEIFTFGEKPYDRIDTANMKAHILSGGRLPQPDICTSELYQVMLKCWEEDPEARPNFNELYELFTHYIQQPNVYLHPRSISSIATGYPEPSVGGTRSRATLYPSFHLSNDRSNGSNNPQGASPIVNPSHESNSTGIYGSGNQLTGNQFVRRFDPGRRVRGSYLVPAPNMATNGGRFGQNRRSVGVPSEHALFPSLNMNSSALGDPWNHGNPAHHSHPILAETNEPSGSTAVSRKYALPTGTSPLGRTIHPFHAALLLNTDSKTSSGQPLLSSDQDSSLSQLVLSNLGYNSSESRSSMIGPTATNGTEQLVQPHQDEPTSSQPQNTTENCDGYDSFATTSDTNCTRNSMPPNFELEAAAGYVWPQWPSVFAQAEHSQAIEGTEGDFHEHDHPLSQHNLGTPGSQVDSDDSLPFLNRQLWLRRSARQRQYYLRQWQIHRSAMGMALPELATEEAIAESENTHSPTESVETGSIAASRTAQNESDGEDPADRYCPDPTSSVPSMVER